MFDFSFAESIKPPAVLYTQIEMTHPISAKIHKSAVVYFLISIDVTGICSRYITLVWTHSKFTFTHMCKSTHVQIYTRKQIFAVWMGLKSAHVKEAKLKNTTNIKWKIPVNTTLRSLVTQFFFLYRNLILSKSEEPIYISFNILFQC